jgi:CRP/FNR family transcriptional regulator, cyclic AMP receptor protein
MMTRAAMPHKALAQAEPPWPRGTLLAVLPPEHRDVLLTLGWPRRYEDHEDLLTEGEESTHVLLFIRASARVTASLENGRVALLGIRVSGDIVGEMAAFDGSPRSATVTACGPADVRVIPREQFIGFLRSCPEANMAVSGMISQRLRWANRRRVDFNGYPCRIRLPRALVELAAAYGHARAEGITFDVGLRQDELATLVGANTDTIGKELRKLQRQKLIRIGYRKIVICDLAGLKALARMSD